MRNRKVWGFTRTRHNIIILKNLLIKNAISKKKKKTIPKLKEIKVTDLKQSLISARISRRKLPAALELPSATVDCYRGAGHVSPH